jgi:hypothetical protein
LFPVWSESLQSCAPPLTILSVRNLRQVIGTLVHEDFLEDVEAGIRRVPMSVRVTPYLMSLVDCRALLHLHRPATADGAVSDRGVQVGGRLNRGTYEVAILAQPATAPREPIQVSNAC